MTISKLQVGIIGLPAAIYQGLLGFVSIGHIIKNFSNFMLLKPGHGGTLRTHILVKLVNGHLVCCVFKFFFLNKNSSIIGTKNSLNITVSKHVTTNSC